MEAETAGERRIRRDGEVGGTEKEAEMCKIATDLSTSSVYSGMSLLPSPSLSPSVQHELFRLQSFESSALSQLRQLHSFWQGEINRAVAEIATIISAKCQSMANDILSDSFAPFPDSELGKTQRLDLNFDLKEVDINTLIKQFVNLTVEYAPQNEVKNRYLYKFFGGQSLVTRFNICTQEVEDTHHCSEVFLHNSAWLVTGNGEVYVTGGSLMGRSKRDVMRVCVETWTVRGVEGMGNERRSHAMAEGKEGIYVFGGVDGDRKLRESECYSEEKQTWRPICGLVYPRAYLGCTVYHDHIYLAGGADESGLEIYSPVTGTMRVLELTAAVTEACSVIATESGILVLHGNYQGEVLKVEVETGQVLRLCDMCHGNSWSNCPPLCLSSTLYTLRSDTIFQLDTLTLQSAYVSRLSRTLKKRPRDLEPPLLPTNL